MNARSWRRALVVAAAMSAAPLVGPPRALALDPSNDIRQYGHTAWKVRDGSFEDSIAAIAQTPDGYLWLGTQFGLLRFDGVRHVLWHAPPGPQLPSTNVRSLFAGSDGRLWIGTQLGLASWKDGTLTIHEEIPRLVGGMAEDRDGTVWVGTRFPRPGKLCAFRRDAVQCFGEHGEFGVRASSVLEDRAGNLWVGAESGLWRWRPGSPQRYPLDNFEGSEGLVQTGDGLIVIADRKGLKRLVDGKVVEYPLPDTLRGLQPSRLLLDRDGALWIGTFDRGLVHVRRGGLDQFTEADGLSGNYVRDIFEDREGNIWVATDNGLDRFRDTAVTTLTVSQGLSQGTPWSVLVSRDGSVWVGTLGGLNRLQNGHVTIYRHRPTAPPPAPTLLAVREIADPGLPDDLIQSLFEDQRGRIWVSTRQGVAFFEHDRFTRVAGIPGGVHAMTGDAAGHVWISEDERLLQVVDGRVAAEIPWASLGRNVPAIPILADPERGGLWLGARDGSGVAYFKDGRIVASYGPAEGLGRGMVGDLYLDAERTLWAATEGGLSRIRDGRVHTLTADNGLPCNAALWAIEDGEGAFWLYMGCGLTRVARAEVHAWAASVERDGGTSRSVQATVFDSSDGVRIHSAPGGYTPQVGRSPDGRLWFLPWDGVSVIDPRRLKTNRLPPPVHIEQVTADGVTYAATPGLELPPLARDVAIDYTALSLIAPERTRFRFKLEGQDPEWRDVANDRRVEYSNLGPGTYRFRVTASNNSGVWNEAGATLAFAIAPAYYQTGWFRALSAGAVLIALAAAYRLRIRQLGQQERKLKAIVDSIPAIAGIARPDGSTEYLNRRWLEFTGLPAGGAGSGWHAAVHPDDTDAYLARWRASLAGGEPLVVEARFRASDGTYRWLLVRAVPVRDRRDAIRAWYGVMTDIEDQKQAERELERLSGRLINAQEEERSRISRELHDDISQSLGLLAVKIDQLLSDPATPPATASALDRLKRETGEVVVDVHRLSRQLHSSTLDHLGLVPAIRRLVAEFSERHGIPVAFEDESMPSALPPDVALCLFRIVQESLNNIAKHSRARSAVVRVAGTVEGIHLTVADDGVGFDRSEVEARAGLGFVSMRERLRLVQGSVRVDSAADRGTRIEAYVPASSLASERRDRSEHAVDNLRL